MAMRKFSDIPPSLRRSFRRKWLTSSSSSSDGARRFTTFSARPLMPTGSPSSVASPTTSSQTLPWWKWNARDLPISQQHTPPSEWYTDPSWLEHEQATVFRNNWICTHTKHEFVTPGAYRSESLAGEPYFVLRDADEGELRAFYNVCAHHAAEVLTGSGKLQPCEKIVCPYHRWEYDQSGRLTKAARVKGIERFKPRAYGLKPISLAEQDPFIFLHFGDKKRALSEDFSPVVRLLRERGLDNLSFVRRKEYTLECNWKVFAENYLDGGMHVPFVHKNLTQGVEFDTYETELFERCSLQSVEGTSEDTPSAERLAGKSLYFFVYPNLFINRYGRWMDLNYLYPTGPTTCKVVFEYFYDFQKDDPEAPDVRSLIDSSIDASHEVQIEDIGICESVQRGVQSRAYKQREGRYAPGVEHAMYHFHSLLSDDVSSTLV